jgi:hypothetical protein
MKSLLTLAALALSMFAFSSNAEASTCNARLENGRGMTLEYFSGYGYDRYEACEEAKRQCIRAKRNGRYYDRVLRCVVDGQHGGGHGGYNTQTCSVDLQGRYGRYINSFTGRSRGYDRANAKQQACREALRTCNRYKIDYGYHGARCQVNDRRGRW